MRTVIALTGASGAVFGLEFARLCPGEKHLIVSRWGKSVLAQEAGKTVDDLAPYARKVYSNEDLSSPFASGSNPFDAMVIVPCSVSTLSKVACGIGDSLIARAAGVAIKERRKLVLCLRESPLSSIVLENMLRLSQAGAVVMPLSPSFYQGAQTVEDQARLFAERILQVLSPGYAGTGWNAERL